MSEQTTPTKSDVMVMLVLSAVAGLAAVYLMQHYGERVAEIVEKLGLRGLKWLDL